YVPHNLPQAASHPVSFDSVAELPTHRIADSRGLAFPVGHVDDRQAVLIHAAPPIAALKLIRPAQTRRPAQAHRPPPQPAPSLEPAPPRAAQTPAQTQRGPAAPAKTARAQPTHHPMPPLRLALQPSQAVRRFLPFARRRRSTRLPPAVFIRAKNPCTRLLFRRLG